MAYIDPKTGLLVKDDASARPLISAPSNTYTAGALSPLQAQQAAIAAANQKSQAQRTNYQNYDISKLTSSNTLGNLADWATVFKGTGTHIDEKGNVVKDIYGSPSSPNKNVTPPKNESYLKKGLTTKDINDLNAAYKRIQNGMGSDADKANTEYARSKGMWSPSATRDLVSGGSDTSGTVNMAGISQDKQGIDFGSTRGPGIDSTRPPITGNQPAPIQPIQPTQPVVDPTTSWQKAMTDLLRGAQGKGLDTDLLGQRNALIQARFGAQTAMTPEQLRVLSPSAQAGLRGQDVSGLESQLSGVQTALQGREKERSELRSVMENAIQRLADLESEERGYAYDTAKEERAVAAKMDEPLSYEEAAALGVAYGTTRREAAAKGIIPTAGAGTDLPNSYQEWQLAGGENSGISYADWVGKGGANGGEDFKQNQYQAATYSTRMEDASSTIDTLGGGFTGMWSSAGQLLPNFLKSEDRQNFEQAERNFVNAVLRRESGSAIAPSEFESAAKQYFPQPGDTAAVIEQKKRNRDVAIAGMKNEAGGAYDLLKQNVGGGGTLLDDAFTQAGFKNAGVALNRAVQQKYSNGNGGQCTTFLHGIAEFPPIGDSRQEKIRSVQKYGFTFNEQLPRVGDIIVTNESDKYGHTALITSIDRNGVATLTESNYAAPNKITYNRKISLNSSNIYGAIRPSGYKFNNLA